MQQDQFFTLASFASLGSASAIVFVVANALQRALNFNPRWFALALSIIVGLIGVAIAPSLVKPPGPSPDGISYLMGFLNGFLIYTTAAGATSVAGGAGGSGNPRADEGKPALPVPPVSSLMQITTTAGADEPRRTFLHPWF